MAEEVIDKPTYMEHVRYFFEKGDHECMVKKGIDLSTYSGLLDRSNSIYFQTKPPLAKMPPQEDRKWSKERSETFLNWIKQDFTRGNPAPKIPSVGAVNRVRKNVEELSDSELNLLKKAFRGIMKKPSSDPKSYFYIAGIHWFPEPSRCEHHTPLYNPWHRAYLELFEDALRSIEGCGTVTLPYWDITKKPPKFLFEPPFDSYVLPEDIHTDYKKDHETKRYSAGQIAKNVKDNKISKTIQKAIKSETWEEFSSHIEDAHDIGHPSCGPSIATPDIASFDPMFWFFHANWDRLWWKWQQRIDATDYWKFRSTIMTSTDFLEVPLNKLSPFSLTSNNTIDLHALGVTYSLEANLTDGEFENILFGNVLASNNIKSVQHDELSVRIKGINRLEIPGTFFVVLKSNDTVVGKKAFFQSFEPKKCSTCRKGAVINVDFLVGANDVFSKNLSVKIEVIERDGRTSIFPLSSVGNPTINARALLR